MILIIEHTFNIGLSDGKAQLILEVHEDKLSVFKRSCSHGCDFFQINEEDIFDVFRLFINKLFIGISAHKPKGTFELKLLLIPLLDLSNNRINDLVMIDIFLRLFKSEGIAPIKI